MNYASCASGGKKCEVFGKFCLHTKWMMPYDNYQILRKTDINTISKNLPSRNE